MASRRLKIHIGGGRGETRIGGAGRYGAADFIFFRDDMRFRRWILVLPLLALVGGGCVSRGPVLEGMDAETLFAHAMAELQARRWDQAGAAFEQFTYLYPNHPRVQEARFRVGETYQGRREWVTAAVEFNRLATEYPAGAWADDARFEVCRSYHELAPRPQLDQEYTRYAVEHCQSLLVYYPDSEFVPRAEAIIAELVDRLAEKEYRIAEDYFRRRAYDSSIIYYESVIQGFETTVWAPRAALRLVEVYERLGYEPEAAAARNRLLQLFPTSPEARRLAGETGSSGT
jgi:outer membrane protein assembly factor BamD